MRKNFGWGVIGPGAIAHRFSEAVSGVDGTKLVAVQSRNVERARAFADKWQCGIGPRIDATDSIDSLLANAAVDAVYIATPHPFHTDAVRTALLARKPVLCEKPLVTDAKQAIELCQLARAQSTFLMEAVWTRFLPIYDVVSEWLQAREIGQLRTIDSSFCLNIPFDPNHRTFNPALGGGSLLDIGIYNITMSRWILAHIDDKPLSVKEMHSRAVIAATGVDQRIEATLSFDCGVSSQFTCGFDRQADNAFQINGSTGSIVLPSRFWEATSAKLIRAGRDPVSAERAFRVNGFEYEIEEVMRCVASGAIQSARISHAETIATLEIMDRIRADVGVRYPWE